MNRDEVLNMLRAHKATLAERFGVVDQGNSQFLPEAKEQFAGVADGWVVAYARVHNAIVVTHEGFNADVRKRVPIPNVCRQFDVDYRDDFCNATRA